MNIHISYGRDCSSGLSIATIETGRMLENVDISLPTVPSSHPSQNRKADPNAVD